MLGVSVLGASTATNLDTCDAAPLVNLAPRNIVKRLHDSPAPSHARSTCATHPSSTAHGQILELYIAVGIAC